MRRIGLMGGTFDPIHNGHLVCAEEASHQFRLDEVIFIPAGRPWQKTDVSSAEDRYMMTMLATQTNPKFSVSRIEIDRGGETYTLDTLMSFKEIYEDSAELFFITGADAVLQILSWREPEAVLSAAHFIAASRPEFDLSKLDDPRFDRRLSIMQIPALAISSTDIRTRVSSSRPIRYLLPREVARYIEERNLYRSVQEVST